MGFSSKRAKAIKEGRVRYNIYDENGLVYSSKTFIGAVQMADQMQKANPEVSYSMKLEEVPDGQEV